ncbi:MAG TPA: 6-carboxytetrahydropterin synthase [Bryobacteraceae bacterium]|nr:6-carboxytetrahydropterin synthase [Bryobacteraceae bacterium]
MRLTRTYRFSASHRLHASDLSEQANAELYGKCNNPYGHGHDYVLHVTAEGAVDSDTGRIAAPGMLDRYVRERVLEVFDHRDMNADVPDFRGVPTTENLASDITRRLCDDWASSFPGIRLHGVIIRETPRNTIELRSE